MTGAQNSPTERNADEQEIHELTAPVTSGEVKAWSLINGNRLDKELMTHAVAHGDWECSCGAGPLTDEEAEKHLQEVA